MSMEETQHVAAALLAAQRQSRVELDTRRLTAAVIDAPRKPDRPPASPD